jgi:3-dehydroquinate dehydratase/shikimate dehydrogenase
MPYKQEILSELENTDPLTRQIGACNTVVRAADGKLYGFNTDVAGIIVPLEQRMSLAGVRVLIVGAGGVARAAAFGLKSKGAEVFLTNRTAEKGQTLARQAKVKYMKRPEVAKQQFDVMINATPVGMGNTKQSPLEEKELNTKYVFDLVYTPAETRLVKMARAKNIQVIPGLEMFVQQGARQFEIWTGKPAPEEEMLRVVLHALKQKADEPEAVAEKPRAKAGAAPEKVAAPEKPKTKAKAK